MLLNLLLHADVEDDVRCKLCLVSSELGFAYLCGCSIYDGIQTLVFVSNTDDVTNLSFVCCINAIKVSIMLLVSTPFYPLSHQTAKMAFCLSFRCIAHNMHLESHCLWSK